jgi:hypothetical protein
MSVWTLRCAEHELLNKNVHYTVLQFLAILPGHISKQYYKAFKTFWCVISTPFPIINLEANLHLH